VRVCVRACVSAIKFHAFGVFSVRLTFSRIGFTCESHAYFTISK